MRTRLHSSLPLATMLFAWAMAAGAGCAIDTSATLPRDASVDAGGGDSGGDGGEGDTGARDSGSDARLDSGEPMDSGTVPDTGGPMDSGSVPDTGGPMDSGSMPDTGGPMDSGTAPDTSVSPDTSTPVTCDSRYGAAAGYVRCAESSGRCEFFTDLERTRTCAGTCAAFGGTCIEQWRNDPVSGGECRRADPTPRTCDVSGINDDICICTL